MLVAQEVSPSKVLWPTVSPSRSFITTVITGGVTALGGRRCAAHQWQWQAGSVATLFAGGITKQDCVTALITSGVTELDLATALITGGITEVAIASALLAGGVTKPG